MGSARIAIAVGAAAALGAVLLLLGGADGSIVTVVALVLAARAAALAAHPGPAGPRSLSRAIALAPAWALLIVAGAMRAGSVELADIRGAHAVAGLALARGTVAMVIAAWLVALAGAAAIAAGASEGRALRGMSPAVPALAPLDALALGAQGVLVTALIAGPTITGPNSILPWIAGVAGVLAVSFVARRRARADVLVRVATASAVLALVSALLGGRL